MAYEVPIGTASLDAFTKSLEESARRVRDLNSETRRMRQSDAQGVSAIRSRAREEHEAFRRTLRERKVAEQEEDRDRKRRWREEDARKKQNANDPFNLERLANSTRLNLGGFSPLVGDVRRSASRYADAHPDTIGGAVANDVVSALGPEFLAAKEAFDAISGISASMGQFVAEQRGFTDAYWRGGASRMTGQGVALAGFAGYAPGQVGDLAGSFGDKLRTGGIGGSYFRNAGLRDQGQWQADKLTNLTKAIDLLAHEKNDKVAIIVARDAGLEGFLGLRELYKNDPGLYTRLKQSGDGLSDPSARNDQERSDAYDQINSNNWRKFLNDMGWAQTKADFSQVANNAATLFTHPLTGPYRLAYNALGGDWSNDQLTPWSKREEEAGGSKDENTAAVKDLTRTIKDHAETIGGGSRTRGAVPVGVKQQMMQADSFNQAQYLGAFTIG